VQVWTPDLVEEVYSISYGSPGEKAAIRIVGCANGTFSGQLVVSSTEEIKALAVKVGPLSGPDGAKLPAEAVAVRYGIPAGPSRTSAGAFTAVQRPRARRSTRPIRRAGPRPSRGRAVVKAHPAPPHYHSRATGRCPICRSPRPSSRCGSPSAREGTPGRGVSRQVSVSAEGAAELPATPIEIDVAGWTLPDVKDHAGELSIYQSPDTLAAYYKVPLWSEAHWKLIEKSWPCWAGSATTRSSARCWPRSRAATSKATSSGSSRPTGRSPTTQASWNATWTCI